MQKSLPAEEGTKYRESLMVHVRKVVPYALFIVVGTGIYMFPQVFGEVGPDGLTNFQILLLIKGFSGDMAWYSWF